MAFDATFYATIALLILLGAFVWIKVPAKLNGALDSRAQRIRTELDEARKLREEAQLLLADYQRKRKEAEAEAAQVLESAKAEAERITAAAHADIEEMIARRTKTAEAKIAQAESQAVAEVRARAADVAIAAATDILKAKVTGPLADTLLDQGIEAAKARLN